MHLTLSPQVGLPGQPETTLHVLGDVLTIDGVSHDLSPVPEGGDGEWVDETGNGSLIVGRIRRIDGKLHVTVQVRLGDAAAADQLDSPWTVEAVAGSVVIPAARRAEPAPEEYE